MGGPLDVSNRADAPLGLRGVDNSTEEDDEKKGNLGVGPVLRRRR